MTREEAALVRLRLMAHRAFGAMVENRRGGSEEAQKDLDALDWAIATIQSKIARPQPDPETGNVGKRVQGCWYCNDDVMQVVDSPNKPPINADYCGLCGRKLEVDDD